MTAADAETPVGGDETELIAAYDEAIARVRAAIAAAYAATPGTRAQRARAALAALLHLAAAEPGAARLCTVDVLRSGDRVRTHRDRSVADLARFVAGGLPGSGAPTLCTSPLAAQLIVGATVELIRRHATEDRLADLPDALPDLTAVATAACVGPVAAPEHD